MNKGFRVFLSCAFGAGIGLLVALEWTALGKLAPIVGFLIGGILAYLGFEFRSVVMVVREVWNEIYFEWRFPSLFWFRAFGWGFLCWTYLLSLVVIVVEIFSENGLTRSDLFVMPIASVFFGAILSFVVLFPLNTQELKHQGDFFMSCFLKLNPVSLCLWYGPKWLILGGVWLIIHAPIFLWRFTREVFVLIHSDIRLLCGCDAALGATIGFFVGNALIGALAGGLLGILNYGLVSCWWFKLHLKGQKEVATT